MAEYKEGISICITAFKAKQFIKETLDSIAAQTWFKNNDNWEVLIGVDYCRETLEYLQSIMDNYKNLRIFMMDSNEGTYVTTNTIMSIAQYDGLLRFDSDDKMRPKMIETIMKNINGVDLLYFKLQNFGTRKSVEQACGQKYIKHTIFDEFGGYRNYRCSADLDLEKRITKFVKTKKISDVLMDRRIHGTNLTVAKETNIMSPYRKKINSQIFGFRYKKKEDAYIECVKNTYKEIFKDTDISEYPQTTQPNLNNPIEGDGAVKSPNFREIHFDMPTGQRIDTKGIITRGKRIMRDGSVF